MYRGFRNHFGESGKMAEYEHFGLIDQSKYLDELRSLKDKLKSNPELESEFVEAMKRLREGNPPYLKREESFELVRRCRKFEPTNPDKPYAYFLRQKILKILKERLPDSRVGVDDDSVLYYTACSDLRLKTTQDGFVETPTDRYHGVDAFFDISIFGKTILITMDGSINPNKTSKADVVTIFPEELDQKTDQTSFDLFVAQEADKIVKVIIGRLDR